MSPDDVLKRFFEKGQSAAPQPVEPTTPAAPTVPNAPTVPTDPKMTTVAKPYDDDKSAPKITVDTKWMDKWYSIFNAKYFDNKLPYPIAFATNNSERTWGRASYFYLRDQNTGRLLQKLTRFKITLSNYNSTSEHTKQGTLLHEMVHIADYYLHPEHFVQNGRRVSRHSYDSHGPIFFLKEAARLKSDGWNITRYVTDEETEDAVVTDVNKARMDARIRDAVAGFLVYKTYKFLFKTDRSSMNDVKRHLMEQRVWYRNKLVSVDFHEVEDTDFGKMRSCKNQMKGWALYSPEEVDKKVEQFKIGKLISRWDFQQWVEKRDYFENEVFKKG